MDVSAPAMRLTATSLRAGCNNSRHSQMALPNKQRCIHQYQVTDVNVASYGNGMCQNHSEAKNTNALAHTGQPLPKRCTGNP
jgi:hypothetical protein